MPSDSPFVTAKQDTTKIYKKRRWLIQFQLTTHVDKSKLFLTNKVLDAAGLCQIIIPTLVKSCSLNG